MENMFKWIDNFWYHYKWHTIMTIIGLIVFLMGLQSCINMESGDTRVILVSEAFLTDKDVHTIEQKISEQITDYNGDGKVTTDLIPIMMKKSMEKTNELQPILNRLNAEIEVGGALIYLADDYGLERLTIASALADISDLGFETKYDGKAIELDIEKFMGQPSETMPDKLYICMRSYKNNDLHNPSNDNIVNMKDVITKIVRLAQK